MIPTTQQAWLVSVTDEPVRQPGGEGSLTCSPRGDISQADHGDRRAMNFQPLTLIGGIP